MYIKNRLNSNEIKTFGSCQSLSLPTVSCFEIAYFSYAYRNGALVEPEKNEK